MSSYANLKIETSEGVTTIAIDRPKALNALNRQTLEELNAAIDALEAGTRVLVIAGGGEKAFVAGADIKEMADLTAAQAADFSRLGHRVFAKLEALDIPVIAKVQGYTLGGGCELMLACDFAIASEKARFGQPEVGLGVTPGFGGTVRLGRRIGDAKARQLLFTGDQIKAPEALAMGLVNEVVAPEALDERVQAIAQKISKNAPQAVAWSKRSARVAEESDIHTANAFEQQVFGLCFATEDQKEGMGAFVEKRKPEWKGK